MKKRCSEDQIIKAIKQYEAGAKVDDVYCRKTKPNSAVCSRLKELVPAQ